MRKFVFMQLLLLLPLASVMSQESNLAATVKELQAACPSPLGAAGEIERVDFDGKTLVFVYSINEGLMNFDVIKENPGYAKAMFANPTVALKEIFKMLLEEDCGFCLKMTEKVTGKSVKCILTKEDMKNIVTGAKSDDPIKILETKIAADNMQLPLNIEEGVTFTKVNISGAYVIHEYSVDESLYPIEALAGMKPELKQGVVLYLIDDPVGKNYARLCKNAGKGIKYRYIGSKSGAECVFEISVEEF